MLQKKTKQKPNFKNCTVETLCIKLTRPKKLHFKIIMSHTKFTAEEEKVFAMLDFQRRMHQQTQWIENGIPTTGRHEQWLAEKGRRHSSTDPMSVTSNLDSLSSCAFSRSADSKGPKVREETEIRQTKDPQILAPSDDLDGANRPDEALLMSTLKKETDTSFSFQVSCL